MSKTLIERTSDVPAELPQFVEEIAGRTARLFGQVAASEYRLDGAKRWAASIQRPDVATYAAYRAGELCALLTGVMRPHILQIPLIHVLRPHEGMGIEGDLLRHAIGDLRLPHIEHILIEAVPFSRLNYAASAQDLGFHRVPRQIMMADLTSPGLQEDSEREYFELDPDKAFEAAVCLCAAYRTHPGRMLHYEVTREEEARAFIWRVLNGYFGRCIPSATLECRMDNRCAGILLASEVMPGTGFILQVAVDPEFQGLGLGTAMIQAAAERFRNAGLDRVGLGVTKNNPARRLYERLGFRDVQDVDAFAWWEQWP